MEEPEMTTLVIQHRVADFSAWKNAFDGDPMGRARNGVIRHAIFRPVDAPDQVVVHLDFAALEKAKEFLGRLQGLWQGAGRQIGFGGPEGVQTRILDEVERVAY